MAAVEVGAAAAAAAAALGAGTAEEATATAAAAAAVAAWGAGLRGETKNAEGCTTLGLEVLRGRGAGLGEGAMGARGARSSRLREALMAGKLPGAGSSMGAEGALAL